MIKIIRKCFSRSLDKHLNIGDEVSFKKDIEDGYILGGFAQEVVKVTKQKKTVLKKK